MVIRPRKMRISMGVYSWFMIAKLMPVNPITWVYRVYIYEPSKKYWSQIGLLPSQEFTVRCWTYDHIWSTYSCTMRIPTITNQKEGDMLICVQCGRCPFEQYSKSLSLYWLANRDSPIGLILLRIPSIIPVIILQARFWTLLICRCPLLILLLSREWGNDPLSLVIINPFPHSHPFPTKHQ